MKGHSRLLYNSTLMLAVLCTCLLLYSMVAMVVCRQQIFVDDNNRGMLSTMEVFILTGFALIPFFNIVSIGWLVSRLRCGLHKKAIRSVVPTLILGLFCLVLLAADKVMIDEIGRELRLGWEVAGEWIILYVLLAIQLVYNSLIFLQLYGVYRGRSQTASEHAV